jgi:hypothetical protein
VVVESHGDPEVALGPLLTSGEAKRYVLVRAASRRRHSEVKAVAEALGMTLSPCHPRELAPGGEKLNSIVLPFAVLISLVARLFGRKSSVYRVE